MRTSAKQERQKAIARLISEKSIGSQEEVLALLLEAGHELTQATLSRDFREMKIAKTPDAEGNYLYQLPTVQMPQREKERYGITASFARHGIINIDFSGQLAVIKTPGGYAQGIAQDIDANNIPGIMATIAGNDTVLIILRENRSKADILNSLKLLFASK